MPAGRSYMQREANILLGVFQHKLLSIGNQENKKQMEKKKKSLGVPSPREHHGEHFCHIFFEDFSIVAQEKNLLSYVMYMILLALERSYYTGQYGNSRICECTLFAPD